MSHGETALSRETIYEGKILRLHRDTVLLENGREAAREVVEHGGGVAVLASPDGENVLLVRQYRHPAGRELLELPAGKLEQGEDPADCARRELEEETGYRAGRLKELGRFFATPGYCTEVLYLYAAYELEATGQHLDPDEFLSVCSMPLAEALAACRNGGIEDAKTALALQLYRPE